MIDRIKQYYKDIDANRIEQALSIFSNNTTYIRGSKIINDLKAFYNSERIIAKGFHFIHTFFKRDDTIIVYGEFYGTSKNNELIETKFRDSFKFNDKYVIERKTIFYGKEV